MRRTLRSVLGALMIAATIGMVTGGVAVTSSGADQVASLACHSAWLTSKIGRSGAAAGTTYYNLEIVNHSDLACTLRGTPTAQSGFITYGMPSFEPVGPPSGMVYFAGRGKTVVIKPGKIASVELGISTAANYPRSKCAPRTISNVEISFLTGTPTVHLGYPLPKQAVCTKIDSTSITGIVLGTHFP
jgi:hypothetical protein